LDDHWFPKRQILYLGRIKNVNVTQTFSCLNIENKTLFQIHDYQVDDL